LKKNSENQRTSINQKENMKTNINEYNLKSQIESQTENTSDEIRNSKSNVQNENVNWSIIAQKCDNLAIQAEMNEYKKRKENSNLYRKLIDDQLSENNKRLKKEKEDIAFIDNLYIKKIMEGYKAEKFEEIKNKESKMKQIKEMMDENLCFKDKLKKDELHKVKEQEKNYITSLFIQQKNVEEQLKKITEEKKRTQIELNKFNEESLKYRKKLEDEVKQKEQNNISLELDRFKTYEYQRNQYYENFHKYTPKDCIKIAKRSQNQKEGFSFIDNLPYEDIFRKKQIEERKNTDKINREIAIMKSQDKFNKRQEDCMRIDQSLEKVI